MFSLQREFAEVRSFSGNRSGKGSGKRMARGNGEETGWGGGVEVKKSVERAGPRLSGPSSTM